MKIELTDEEWTTVLLALDNYRDLKESQAVELGDDALTEMAGSAQWIWQKIFGELREHRTDLDDECPDGDCPDFDETCHH